jgi:hypothetical protein
MKHGTRMHEFHNSYLIASNEYNLYCNYYSEKIFPNLIESYMLIQEKILEELYVLT